MSQEQLKYNYTDTYRFNILRQKWEVLRKDADKYIACPAAEIGTIPPEVVEKEMLRVEQAEELEQHKVADLDAKRKSKQKKTENQELMPWEKYFEEGKRFVSKWLADDIAEKHLNLYSDGQYLSIYQNGYYVKDVKEEIIREKIVTLLGDRSQEKYADATIYHLTHTRKLEGKTVVNPVQFLNCRNGILDRKQMVLIPHTDKIIFTYRLNVNFDPNANDPVIQKFVDSTLPKDAHDNFYEMVGYFLPNNLQLEKAFMLTGEGENGKSKAIVMIAKMFGIDSYANIPLQDFNDKFGPAGLEGKLLNWFTDLEQKPIENTGYFKAIVSGEPIRVQHKYGHPYDMKPMCKLLFSANNFIPTPDDSDGYFRRWMLFDYRNKFKGSERDPDIEAKITTHRAQSTLLNMALIGLARLEKNKQFSESQSVADSIKVYRRHTDSAMQFVEDYCELADEKKITVKNLYDAYKNYCIECGIRSPLGRTNFNKRVASRYKLEYKKARDTNALTWMGIGLSNEYSNDPFNM